MQDVFDCGKVSFYRRPLTSMSYDLAQAEFFIEDLLEPRPQPELKSVDPALYDRLDRNPWFLLIHARKASK